MPNDFDLTWLDKKLDRIAERFEARFQDVLRDAASTRHAQRGTMQQLAEEMVEVKVTQRIQQQDIEDLQADREASSAWRYRVSGALGLVAFLFPVTIGVVLSVR